MAFLDEDEELELDEQLDEDVDEPFDEDLDEQLEEFPGPERELGGGRPPRPPRTPRQQILVRRLVAVGGAGLVLILVVLGFRGCLEARKDRAIRNFVSDSGALMRDSSQVGTDFFGLLNDSGGRSPLEYEAQVKSFRGASETLFDRAQKLDTPDQMRNAKEALVLTLELRRNALTAIGNSIGPALGKENAVDAQKKISEQMRLLFSSDSVCTGVAVPEIVSVTQKEGVGGSPISIPCQFVPDPPEAWLDLTKVTEALSQVSGATTTTSGVHGVEIVSTKIGDTQLLPDTPVTVSTSSAPTLTVEVSNGGESEETEINVTVTIGGTDLAPQVIPRLGAGESIPLKIPITPVPASGEQTMIDVAVEPVPGETVTDNNQSSYTVTFE